MARLLTFVLSVMVATAIVVIIGLDQVTDGAVCRVVCGQELRCSGQQLAAPPAD